MWSVHQICAVCLWRLRWVSGCLRGHRDSRVCLWGLLYRRERDNASIAHTTIGIDSGGAYSMLACSQVGSSRSKLGVGLRGTLLTAFLASTPLSDQLQLYTMQCNAMQCKMHTELMCVEHALILHWTVESHCQMWSPPTLQSSIRPIFQYSSSYLETQRSFFSYFL